MLWTADQRRVVIAIVLGILAYLTVQLWVNPTTVGDPQPSHGARYDELQDRIDPNTATEAELAGLPALGEKRAKLIVEYRQDFLRIHPGRVVFSQGDDLEKIKGIGAATVANLQPYLVFPSEATTRVANR